MSWAMMHGRSLVYWLLSKLDQKYNEHGANGKDKAGPQPLTQCQGFEI